MVLIGPKELFSICFEAGSRTMFEHDAIRLLTGCVLLIQQKRWMVPVSETRYGFGRATLSLCTSLAERSG
jgi:hypothetical protein